MQHTYVMGDIHGAYRGLIQCLEKSGFDYEQDHLICLGDVCDGWPETKRCISELLKITHLTYILGNHDTWLLKWMKTGFVENIWYVQGGEATIDSYAGNPVPTEHREFLENALPYYLTDAALFVHAGIERDLPLESQSHEILLWDRSLARTALQDFNLGKERKLTIYDEVYLGHTPIQQNKPVYASGVWLMDTGAGWNGVLSMMDIQTKRVFTSDPIPTLYPGIEGRKKW